MPTRLGLHGLYAPRFNKAGAMKGVSNYEAQSINADTLAALAALDRLAGYPAYCRPFSTIRS